LYRILALKGLGFSLEQSDTVLAEDLTLAPMRWRCDPISNPKTIPQTIL
jgi:hypothetical protein